jgi:hypothetical protein
MAPFYSFAIVCLAPEGARAERLNLGVAIWTPHGLDVRVSRRLEKVHAISAALDASVVRELVLGLKLLDDRFAGSGSDVLARHAALKQVGPIALSEIGNFSAHDSASYEDRVQTILKAMVDPEPLATRAKQKRSRLLTQIKGEFRKERVLAKKDENLDSHRIVPSFILDEGLVADLVLRNGAIHVVETVDAAGEGSVKRAIGEIGVAALVLERARMKFGDTTDGQIVYSASALLERVAQPSLDAAAHQGAKLVNWASADDRASFLHRLSSVATPLERKRSRASRFTAAAS